MKKKLVALSSLAIAAVTVVAMTGCGKNNTPTTERISMEQFLDGADASMAALDKQLKDNDITKINTLAVTTSYSASISSEDEWEYTPNPESSRIVKQKYTDTTSVDATVVATLKNIDGVPHFFIDYDATTNSVSYEQTETPKVENGKVIFTQPLTVNYSIQKAESNWEFGVSGETYYARYTESVTEVVSTSPDALSLPNPIVTKEYLTFDSFDDYIAEIDELFYYYYDISAESVFESLEDMDSLMEEGDVSFTKSDNTYTMTISASETDDEGSASAVSSISFSKNGLFSFSYGLTSSTTGIEIKANQVTSISYESEANAVENPFSGYIPNQNLDLYDAYIDLG